MHGTAVRVLFLFYFIIIFNVDSVDLSSGSLDKASLFMTRHSLPSTLRIPEECNLKPGSEKSLVIPSETEDGHHGERGLLARFQRLVLLYPCLPIYCGSQASGFLLSDPFLWSSCRQSS